MTAWERILAIVGAVASIIALVDSLFFKSQLASALSIPPTMPTGVAAIAVFVACLSVLLALRRISSLDRKLGKADAEKIGLLEEKSGLLEERSAALQEISQLKRELRLLTAKSESPSDLEDRVYAVLIRKEASAIEILQELELDRSYLPNCNWSYRIACKVRQN